MPVTISRPFDRAISSTAATSGCGERAVDRRDQRRDAAGLGFERAQRRVDQRAALAGVGFRLRVRHSLTLSTRGGPVSTETAAQGDPPALQRHVNHPRFTSVNHKPRLARPRGCARAACCGTGFGCRSARSSPCLRRMRSHSPQRVRRRACAPPSRTRATTRRARSRAPSARGAREPRAGALPSFDNPESSELPRFGNPPAPARAAPVSSRPTSAAASGPTGATRAGPACRPTGIGLAPPLSLTAPGTSPTAILLRSTAAGTSVRSTGATGRPKPRRQARRRRRRPRPRRRAIRWCAFRTARRPAASPAP